MIIPSIGLLIISFLTLLFVLIKKKINIVSNYTVYIFFSILYSVFPTLTFLGIEPQVWFRHYTLNGSEILISTQIAIMSLCNVVFAHTFYTRYKKSYLVLPNLTQSLKKDSYKNVIFITYTTLCVLLLYFGYKYSYTSGRGEVIHSIISNAKTILASVYIYFLVRYRLNYRLLIMFLSYLLLLFVEQSRWYFVSVLVASLFYIQNVKEVKQTLIAETRSYTVLIDKVKLGKLDIIQLVAILVIFSTVLSYVGLARSSVEVKDFLIFLNPFYIEGDYGSYMILQTYDLIYKGGIEFYTLFLDYLIDPVIYLLPRFLFIVLGLEKDKVGIFSFFVSFHEHYLTETYSPVGGFHYIAQASSAFPFLGPLLVTYIFAVITVRVENSLHKNSSKLNELNYYLYSAGFAFVFIKTLFHQTIKYYLTLAIPAYILFYLLKTSSKRKAGYNHDKKLLH